MTGVTYWHVAHPSYQDGDDLLCRNQLAQEGRTPEWSWQEAAEGFDADVVCLFPDTPRGRAETDWLWDERSDYTLVRVNVPDGVHDDLITKVEEGYPAVLGRIPAQWCTTVRRGYAPDTVTQDGDSY